MSRKPQFHLIVSPEMSSHRETGSIRFPRRTRESLGLTLGHRVQVDVKGCQLELLVRKARIDDVKELNRLKSTGEVSKKESTSVGFVAKATRDRITQKEDQVSWTTPKLSPVTVGADPEFGLIDRSGSLIRARAVLPREGRFGSDGPGAEVRPQASKDHLALIKNIGKLLQQPPAKASGANDYDWIGGATFEDHSRKYWFGGHIHLGRPRGLSKEVAPACYRGIAMALDHLIALPLVRLDTPNPHNRRNGCQYGYGKAGTLDNGRSDASLRMKDDGGRFEYRVLSGLWVTHPDLAKSVLGATKCVVETVYARAAACGYDPEWMSAPASRKGLAKSLNLKGAREVIALINRSDPAEVTGEHLRTLTTQLRELDLYDCYKREVDALLGLAKLARPNGFQLDLKQNWIEESPLLPKASKKVRACLEPVEEM